LPTAGSRITLEHLLKAVNAKLRAQAAAAQPRVADLRKALTQVERQITNYTRAIGRGDFASLEIALGAAEQRRAALQAELAQRMENSKAQSFS